MVPCLAVFPISPRFGKVDLEILKQLADVYYAFLYYKMKDMFNNKPSEIRTLIYEELKTKKGEFFQWMVDEYLPNAPRIKKERENLSDLTWPFVQNIIFLSKSLLNLGKMC